MSEPKEIWVVEVRQPPILDDWTMKRAEPTQELAEKWKMVGESVQELGWSEKQPPCYYRVRRYIPAEKDGLTAMYTNVKGGQGGQP